MPFIRERRRAGCGHAHRDWVARAEALACGVLGNDRRGVDGQRCRVAGDGRAAGTGDHDVIGPRVAGLGRIDGERCTIRAGDHRAALLPLIGQWSRPVGGDAECDRRACAERLALWMRLNRRIVADGERGGAACHGAADIGDGHVIRSRQGCDQRGTIATRDDSIMSPLIADRCGTVRRDGERCSVARADGLALRLAADRRADVDREGCGGASCAATCIADYDGVASRISTLCGGDRVGSPHRTGNVGDPFAPLITQRPAAGDRNRECHRRPVTDGLWLGLRRDGWGAGYC